MLIVIAAIIIVGIIIYEGIQRSEKITELSPHIVHNN
jgi:hypothetical protein